MTERRLKDRMRQNRRKAKKRLRRKLIFAGLIAVFVLLIVLCVYLGLRSYVNRIPEDQILDNVFIGTVEVSGMSREEAKTAVESHYQEHLGYTAVLRVQDESAEATMDELGLKAVDLDGLVEEALANGEKMLVIMAHGGTQMAIMERYALPQYDYYHWCGPNAGGYVLEADAETWHNCHTLSLVNTVQYVRKEGGQES